MPADSLDQSSTLDSSLAPSPLPQHLYKIIPADAAPPSDLPEALPLSDLDKKDRYIHLSTAIQVPGTGGRFFASTNTLYIAKIRYGVVASDIRWEVAGSSGGVFAHLYNGGRLGKGEIDAVKEWKRSDGETWEDVFKNDAAGDVDEPWLTY